MKVTNTVEDDHLKNIKLHLKNLRRLAELFDLMENVGNPSLWQTKAKNEMKAILKDYSNKQ